MADSDNKETLRTEFCADDRRPLKAPENILKKFDAPFRKPACPANRDHPLDFYGWSGMVAKRHMAYV
jgi:hypothetical protein